jgi:hypothetical protein
MFIDLKKLIKTKKNKNKLKVAALVEPLFKLQETLPPMEITP